MLNFRRREERRTREYRGNTIFVTKSYEKNVEKLLDIIVRNIEGFVEQRKQMPKRIHLSRENYERIKKYNKTLIEKRKDKYYTFGVEIEVQ